MPILPNAKKALRASKRKAEVNQKIKSRVRSALKIVEQKKDQESLRKAYAAIDKAVKKNIFHSNKGARLKNKAAKLLQNKKSSAKKSK